MKTRLLNFFCILFIGFVHVGFGQTFTNIANDNANGYGTAWAGNGGSGFGNWLFRANPDGGFAGEFLEQNANFASPAISTSNKSLGTFANGGIFPRITAFREFNQSLKPGDRFTVEIQHDGITNGGSVGFTLRSGNNNLVADDYNSNSRFEFVFVGGSSNYSIFANSTTDTGIGFTNGGIRIEVTMVDLNTVDVAVTTLFNNNTTNFSSLILGGTSDDEILSLALFNRNARNANAYFNNISVNRETYTTTQDGDYTDINTWVNGVVPPNNGRGLIQINHNVDLNADLEVLNQLVISSPNSMAVQPSNVITIGDVATLEINSGANLTFKSDVTGTAQFGELTTGSLVDLGSITVERHIPAKRAFRLLASPVTTTDFIFQNWQDNGSTPPTITNNVGTHITGSQGTPGNVNTANGLDETISGNASMFTFDNTDTGLQGTAAGAWQPVTNTLNTRLESETPYLILVRGDRSIDLNNNNATPVETVLSATGSIFTGSSSLDTDPLTASSPGKAPAQELSDVEGYFSLVANPYQAVVDFREVQTSNLRDFVHIWDANIGGINGNGGYVTVNVSTNTPTTVAGGGTSSASALIPPGASFFVQNLTSSPTVTYDSPTILFEEDDKATAQTQVGIFNENPNFYIHSGLFATSDFQSGNTEKDAFYMMFSNQYTTPGSSEDADKYFNPNENFAVINNGFKSFDLRQLPQAGEEIGLWTDGYTESNYTLYFDIANKPEELKVYLKDHYLNTQVELTGDDVYNFAVDANIPASIAGQRFSIWFENTTLGLEDNSFGEGFALYPNPSQDGRFSIKTPGLKGQVNLEITNLLGQQILFEHIEVSDEDIEVDSNALSSGLYIVKLSQQDKSFSQKLIVH